jgi:hypothetical protein
MMKKLSRAALLLVAALAIPAAALADAGKGGGADDAQSIEERCKQRFEQRAERRQERLHEFDQNGDGVLDDAERTAMRAERAKEMEARRMAHFDEMDTDGDGVLTREEFAAAKPKHFGGRGVHGGGRPMRGQ